MDEKFEVLIDLLGLVGEEVTDEWLEQRTEQECSQLEEWAAREYLHASDNPIRRKKRPECLDNKDA